MSDRDSDEGQPLSPPPEPLAQPVEPPSVPNDPQSDIDLDTFKKSC